MQKPTRGNRVGSMILDHMSMTFIITMFSVPFYIYNYANLISGGIPNIFNNGIYIVFIGFALYFCKDCINGRSLAKRGLNLQVVNSKTEIAASPYRCLVRNLFLIIWPIEFIVALINPSQRIGDLVAGTKVVAFDKSVEQPKTNFINALGSLAICYILFLPLALLMSIAQDSIDKEMEDYSIETYHYTPNDDFTYNLLTELDDSLDSLIIPKGDVYDAYTPGKKKLELMIWVKKWSLDDSTGIETIHDKVISIIKDRYPSTEFSGNIEYQYKENENAPLSKVTYSVNIRYEEEEKELENSEELDTIIE